MSAITMETLRQRLTQTFAPQRLEILDDSQRHAGHASAQGGGHFHLLMVSERFAGKTLVERHRMIYAALSDVMGGAIHALGIKAIAPGEPGAQ